jgi:hypothetical protein
VSPLFCCCLFFCRSICLVNHLLIVGYPQGEEMVVFGWRCVVYGVIVQVENIIWNVDYTDVVIGDFGGAYFLKVLREECDVLFGGLFCVAWD